MKFILNPVVIAMLGVSSLQVQATNDTETMVVTANRSAQSISDIAATVLVIEEAQIAEQAKSGIEFKALLANLIPSLDVSSQSRTNAGQNMRGRKTLVMIDGVSLNSSRSISRQFDSINPFNIARIEVISGASAMYGGGSTGGIVNIITKKGNDLSGVNSETWLGAKSGFNHSDDLEFQVAQAVSTSTDDMDARLAVSYNKSGSTYDANGDMILQDVTQTSSQHVSQLDIMASTGFQISETKRIELMAQYYDSGQNSDYGVDYGTNFANAFDQSKQVTMSKDYDLAEQAETVRSLITANYIDSDFYNQTLNFQLFYRQESSRFNPFPDLATYGYLHQSGFGAYDSIVTFSGSEQQTQVMGAKLVLTADPTDNLNLVYGMDFDYEVFNATQTAYNFSDAKASGGLIHNKIGSIGRYPDIKNTSFASFLQANYDVNSKLSINGGVRYQYTKTDVSDFVAVNQQYMILLEQYDAADAVEGGEKDYSNLLFNAGLIYELAEEQQVWINLSQGFEVPDPAKYYGRGQYSAHLGAIPNYGQTLNNGVSVGESPLEGVKTNALELGWRLFNQDFSTQLVAYTSRSDKEIKYNSSTQSVEVLDNDERIVGLEGQVDYFATNEISLGSNFNYIITEVKSDGSWKDKDVDYASPSKLSAYVTWQSDNLTTRLQTMQMFSYTDDNDAKLHSYNTVDLLTGFALPIGKLQLSVTNLFNTDYETLWSQRAQEIYGIANLSTFNGQGRTYSANYSVNF